jgi:hypothetical protein
VVEEIEFRLEMWGEVLLSLFINFCYSLVGNGVLCGMWVMLSFFMSLGGSYLLEAGVGSLSIPFSTTLSEG